MDLAGVVGSGTGLPIEDDDQTYTLVHLKL
jgi:hypothetical protein